MKTLFISIFTTILYIANVSAQTSGHYVGVDFNYTDIKHDYKGDNDAQDSSDDTANIGINYGYKYSFANNLFISPEIFIDNLDSDAVDRNYHMKIDYIYGVKTKFGYNVQKDLAVFALIGFNEVKWSMLDTSDNIENNYTDTGAFYGLGASYNIAKQLSLKAEYSFQNIDLKYSNTEKEDTDLNSFKLGIAYNF